MVGPTLPGHPRGIPPPDSYPVKPAPVAGDLRPNLGGGLTPHTADRQAIGLPGFNFPPQGAYPVDQQADAAIAPGASATLITVVVPQGSMLRVAGIGFDAFDPIALSYLTWSLLVAGQPDRAYTNQTAVIGSIRTLADIVFFVANQTTLTLVASVAAAAPVTYTYAARLRGWFYSENTG
jgi:hypothetical protein